MQRRHISHIQPEPGKKLSRPSFRKYKELDRYRPHAAALSVAAGALGAGISYALRAKALNDEMAHRNNLVKELSRLQSSRTTSSSVSISASGNVDSFLTALRAGMIKDLQGRIGNSELLLMEMESDIPGYSSARDGAIAMAAFAAAMIIAVAGITIGKRREEREEALKKKPGEQPRGRKTAQEMEDIGHTETCIPAPAAPPKQEVPEARFKRPEYYDKLFPELKRSIREEMGPLGSEEAAEAFLCVMPRSEIEELINWPETMVVHIEKNRDGLREFLQEKRVDPRHLFARLGPEVTGLF